jgi:hypothetical protein
MGALALGPHGPNLRDKRWCRDSTLITSAPQFASNLVAKGPTMESVRSMILIRSRGKDMLFALS